LIDPTEIPAERLQDLVIEDQWHPGALLNRQGLRAGLDGFHHRFPEQKDALPGYWLKIWQDGLMEFGETITIGGDDRRLLPYISLAELIHDYTELFAKVLQEVGYLGDAVAIATLGDVKGFTLGLPPGAYFDHHPVEVEQVKSRSLRASVSEMPDEVNRWTKKTMDRVFLAAGIASGAFFISDDGLVEK
jgi:hypothetical protein